MNKGLIKYLLKLEVIITGGKLVYKEALIRNLTLEFVPFINFDSEQYLR